METYISQTFDFCLISSILFNRLTLYLEYMFSVAPKVGSQKRNLYFHSPVIFLVYVYNWHMGIIGRSVQYDHQIDLIINIGQSYS